MAREPRLRCYSHIDERCAGFFALGLAKASGLPVAVACTSGTAAAELLPAAVEAREARVPLLLLTADRPAELRENGAGQAIDQLKLYGDAAKWFFEVGGRTRRARSSCAGCARSRAALTGPRSRADRESVHLNFPLREPLVSEDELPEDTSGRRDGAPYVRRSLPALVGDGPDPELLSLVAGARRGVLVAGRHERATPLGEAACDVCARRGLAAAGRPAVGRAPR